MRKTILAAVVVLAGMTVSAPIQALETSGHAFVTQTASAYAFPNPARQAPSVTFHAEVGQASGVRVSVYNVAGELVHEGQVNGDPMVIDGAHAYEYKWDLSNVASGSYFLIVRADGVDGRGVVAKKSFTVIN